MSERKNHKKYATWLFTFIKLILASVLYSIGVALFLDPNNLAPGGVTGISILLNRLTFIDTGTLILLLNIPLLLIAWKKFGLCFVTGTLFVLILISGITNYLQRFEPLTGDMLLASAGGGICIALGLGIVLKCGVTTGGTDIVVRLLRIRYPHIKTGALFLLVDLTIIAGSFLVFHDLEKVMYAIIAVMVTSWGLDLVLYGKDEARLIYVISDKTDVIAKLFMDELHLGVTFLEGTGAYTDKKKKIIMCVAKKRIAPKVEEVVKLNDTNAFMIVTDADEIFGQGYKSYHGERY